MTGGCPCGHKPMFCHRINANRWCGSERGEVLTPDGQRYEIKVGEHLGGAVTVDLFRGGTRLYSYLHAPGEESCMPPSQ